ncbi:MAG: hypothetical protein HOM52_17840, partial [Rhodospirillaceae bacterium]|nr:hypothetical protein [Rhodospirillaceae bacterium]
GLSEDESFLLYWCREYVIHHDTWLAAIRDRPGDFLVIKYEDMLEQCAGLLPAMISFTGLDAPPLTSDQILTLAAMYTRRQANWRSEDDIAYRDRKFRQLENIICSGELERLDDGLAHRVKNTCAQLDDLRLRPSQA